MEDTIQNIRSKMIWLTANPAKLFMLDGAGAFLDAFLLGAILANFEEVFGMPSAVLYFLSAMAFFYGIYSLSCAYFVTRSWRPFMVLIVVANFLHGCLTIGLVVYHFHRLTVLGVMFFMFEILVLGCVVFLEVRALGRKDGYFDAA